MNKRLIIALRLTAVTTILFGLIYPLGVTVLSRLLFPRQADGSLIVKGQTIVGSSLIGQSFTGERYFHSRPSSAGAGYDASASSGSNLGPMNRQLVERVQNDVRALQSERPDVPIPADLVTTSGSGLDPDISVAGAEFQIARVARARGVRLDAVENLVAKHTTPRQFGVLGEPRVNVLELNLDLDATLGPNPAVVPTAGPAGGKVVTSAAETDNRPRVP